MARVACENCAWAAYCDYKDAVGVPGVPSDARDCKWYESRNKYKVIEEGGRLVAIPKRKQDDER